MVTSPFGASIRHVATNASPSQRRLLDSYYQGSIPALVVRAPDGALVYSQAGETAGTRGDTRALDSIIGKALGR